MGENLILEWVVCLLFEATATHSIVQILLLSFPNLQCSEY